VLRRVHVHELRPGDVELDAEGAHHARNVLRLTVGTIIELFDDAGAVAQGEIVELTPRLVVRVGEIAERASGMQLTIASAVPKGDRADWMIEKLSELGCSRFIPLAAARSVVLPEGRNKRERWVRIATEAAKQSRRAGVMQIGELTPVAKAIELAAPENRLVLSTVPSAKPIAQALEGRPSSVSLFVGPEGGWHEDELALFDRSGVLAVKLTSTVLRVETAAIAAATLALVLGNEQR